MIEHGIYVDISLAFSHVRTECRRPLQQGRLLVLALAEICYSSHRYQIRQMVYRPAFNEGVDLMNAGQQIDQLHNFSNGQKAADSIAIQQAGLIDPTKVFIGNILQAAGSAGMMYGSGAGGQVTDKATSLANGSADPIGSLNDSMNWTGGGDKSWIQSFKTSKLF
ncbi:hypothetical protein [Polynucleobacter sp. MWH-Berg-3C6]|uniref:hypothetical protein n=1 Tax=Polynucleobacter sp. MWH-Berg-3C6 TaxID=1855882 RepID=UPI001C0D60C8|nr:hypothetical protein [Polynucleobacter sp. MWH-Berg-3C6]MBU3551395.1 hypothetical protein [Polynucleobacter sp. MWH-Berg-3C6]